MYFIFINKWISLCVGIIFHVVTDGRLIHIMLNKETTTFSLQDILCKFYSVLKNYHLNYCLPCFVCVVYCSICRKLSLQVMKIETFTCYYHVLCIILFFSLNLFGTFFILESST